MPSRSGWTALLLALLPACNPAPPEGVGSSSQPRYFDVKGLLDQQVQQLSAQQRAVRKHATLRDSAPETVRVAPVKWADELQIFYQADINKAALRGAYTVDSVRLPDGLLRRTYTRQHTQANAPVRRLEVLSQGAEARQIEAWVEQHTALFDAQKVLRLELANKQLTNYEVAGSQKLIFFDNLRYTVRGQVE